MGDSPVERTEGPMCRPDFPGKPDASREPRLRQWRENLPGTTLRLLSITGFGHLTAIEVATSTRTIKRDFRALGQQVKGSEEQVAFFSILPVVRNDEGRNTESQQVSSWCHQQNLGGFGYGWVYMTSGLLASEGYNCIKRRQGPWHMN